MTKKLSKMLPKKNPEPPQSSHDGAETASQPS